MESTVVFYCTSRGYGFLADPDGDGDVFFHCASVRNAERRALRQLVVWSGRREPSS